MRVCARSFRIVLSGQSIILFLLINVCIPVVAWERADVQQREVFLIQDKKTTGTLVLPVSPTKVEVFAAEEIQKYLHKITGVQVPIVKTQHVPKGPAIVIGNHPANATVLQKLKTKYPIVPGHWKTTKYIDAFALVLEGETLHLTGQSGVATLYAAWDWLEALGVQWIMPGDFGTYVPSKNQIVLTSGLGGIYPAGLRIGYITKIEVEPNGLMKQAEVKPFVDFDRLEEVLVLTKPKNEVSVP